MTLVTNGDDILTTLNTNGEDILMTPMTSGEDTVITPVTTRAYLVNTLHDITDDPCDKIDNLEQITVKFVERLMVGIAGEQVPKKRTR